MPLFSSIKARLLSWLMGLVLLTGLGIGYSSYVILYDTLVENQQSNLVFAANTESQRIEEHIQIREEKFRAIAKSNDVLRYSKTFSGIHLYEYFDQFKDEFPILSFVMQDGREELRIDNGANSIDLTNISNTPLYKALMQSPNSVITRLEISSRTRLPELVMAYYRKNFFDVFEGIIVARIPLSNIFQPSNEVKIGKSGFLNLIDSEARVLVGRNVDNLFKKVPARGDASVALIQNAIKMQQGFGRANIMGLDCFVAFAPVSKRNWSMLAIMPYEEFIAAPNELRNIYLVLLLFIISIGILASFYLASAITKPIINLTRTSEKIANGDLAQRVEINSQDEIGNLGKSFNLMAENLEYSQTELKKIAENRELLLQELEKKHKDLLFKEHEQNEILQSMVSGVISINEFGTILSFNKSAEVLFGYTAQEIIGKNVNILMPSTVSKNHNNYLKQYCETDEAHVIGTGINADGLRKDKTLIPLHLTIAELPKEANGTRRFIGSCVDLTNTKRQEEQLRRSQKMEALGKLTGGIAHDYNNMLGVILGYSEILENALRENQELSKYVKNINHAAKRGTALTKRLLSFSRHKRFESTVFNINSLIENQELMLEKTLTARIDLVFDLDPKLKLVELDSGDLEDALVNLCINAMHAMENGGQLTIQTQNRVLSNNDSDMFGVNAGEYVVLSVTDTGCGMSKETTDRIFDPFFTTKGEKGTGLGLSQVYGFVERSKGTIKVYSDLGHGSRFSLFFPVSDKKSFDNETSAIQITRKLEGTETILVVDDEQAMLSLTRNILEPNGYRVLTADDGEQALEIIKHENIDLLLTDVIMPKMDGYQLAKLVQEYYPRVNIQIMSGFADGRHHKMMEDKLHRTMINKPFDSQTLLKRIREQLDTNKPHVVLHNCHVLIMDDDEDIQELYKLHISKLGCKMIKCLNGDEAIKQYQQRLQSESPVDIAILDLSIPGGMGGKEVARKIREIDSRAKLIVSSGDSTAAEMTHYQEYGFNAALEKNFKRKVLQQTLESVLSEEQ
ncbi:MAG TPA: response regulator [Gammaproteobacteria bacterium]|nr:response regulator [Gammaproteobacteria bacterium]